MTVIHTIKNKICSTITKMINLCFIIPAFEYFIRNPFPFFNRKHMFDTICIIKPEHLFVNRFMIWSLHKGTLRLRFKINRISVYPADTCEWERHWFDPQLNHINFKKTSVEWKTSSQFLPECSHLTCLPVKRQVTNRSGRSAHLLRGPYEKVVICRYPSISNRF